MTASIPSLGMIAGNRTLPLEFARQARAGGVQRLVAAAFEGETDPSLTDLVDEIVWLRVGQLSKLIKAFTQRGISQCVMVGQIAPDNLYNVRPDLRAMGVLLRLKERNAHTLFTAVADELRKDGVEVVEATPWLQALMPDEGFRLGAPLSKVQQADVEFGLRVVREVARLDIGQAVVVKEGTVLAVEAFEGTDECLARGGRLAGPKGGAVAVKLAKADHDMRFDIPCVGRQTLESCANHGVAVLAVEAGRTLLLDRADAERLTSERRVSLVTV